MSCLLSDEVSDIDVWCHYYWIMQYSVLYHWHLCIISHFKETNADHFETLRRMRSRILSCRKDMVELVPRLTTKILYKLLKQYKPTNMVLWETIAEQYRIVWDAENWRRDLLWSWKSFLSWKCAIVWQSQLVLRSTSDAVIVDEHWDATYSWVMVEGVTKGFITKDGKMVDDYVIIDNWEMVLTSSILEGWSF